MTDMTMRDRIEAIARFEIPSTIALSKSAGLIADAIIAALPGMVPELVWEFTAHKLPEQNGWRATGVGIRYTVISAPDNSRAILSSYGGADIGTRHFHESDAAFIAANALHRAAVCKAMGL